MVQEFKYFDNNRIRYSSIWSYSRAVVEGAMKRASEGDPEDKGRVITDALIATFPRLSRLAIFCNEFVFRDLGRLSRSQRVSIMTECTKEAQSIYTNTKGI